MTKQQEMSFTKVQNFSDVEGGNSETKLEEFYLLRYNFMMSSKRPVNVPYILKSQPSKQQHTAGIQL
jgi:hypothetical protein